MSNNAATKLDATGYIVMRDALKDLLNSFPGLTTDEKITFEEVGKESGIAFYNNAGAIIYNERVYVSGKVFRQCSYPFFVVYRAAASAKEKQKLAISEFLDALGEWLCKEEAIINGTSYQLSAWPELSGGRKITKVTRENAYGSEPQTDGVQDWVLPVTIYYTTEFQR